MEPQLDPPGGGDTVVAWMLQALRDEYRLTLVCWRTLNLEHVNSTFATSLRPEDFDVLPCPARSTNS